MKVVRRVGLVIGFATLFMLSYLVGMLLVPWGRW
jgi:hypothetical protein